MKLRILTFFMKLITKATGEANVAKKKKGGFVYEF